MLEYRALQLQLPLRKGRQRQAQRRRSICVARVLLLCNINTLLPRAAVRSRAFDGELHLAPPGDAPLARLHSENVVYCLF